jgi:hypothetical protein
MKNPAATEVGQRARNREEAETEVDSISSRVINRIRNIFADNVHQWSSVAIGSIGQKG